MTSTLSVFWAAVRLGITRIVHASSETVVGLPFDVPPPYIPVDEEDPPRPESVHSLVKTLEEQLARELVRWHPEDDAAFPFDADARARKRNLWSSIDAPDGAQAVQRAPAGSSGTSRSTPGATTARSEATRHLRRMRARRTARALHRPSAAPARTSVMWCRPRETRENPIAPGRTYRRTASRTRAPCRGSSSASVHHARAANDFMRLRYQRSFRAGTARGQSSARNQASEPPSTNTMLPHRKSTASDSMNSTQSASRPASPGRAASA